MSETVEKRRRRRRQSLPVLLVFLGTLGAACVAAGLAYALGPAWPWTLVLPLLAIGLIAWVLYANDRRGFGPRTNQMRRAFEPRRHLNQIEVVLLCVLIMVNAFVVAFRLII